MKARAGARRDGSELVRRCRRAGALFAGAACASGGLRSGFGLLGVTIAAALGDRAPHHRLQALAGARAAGARPPHESAGLTVRRVDVARGGVRVAPLLDRVLASYRCASRRCQGGRHRVAALNARHANPYRVASRRVDNVVSPRLAARDGLIRCDDYLRFRSEGAAILPIPTTRALAGSAPIFCASRPTRGERGKRRTESAISSPRARGAERTARCPACCSTRTAWARRRACSRARALSRTPTRRRRRDARARR